MTMQSNSFVRRRSIRAATALALGLPLLLSGLAGPAAAAPPAISTTIQNSPLAEVPELYQDGHYIVMLEAQPVATYDGGVAGIAPTKPEKGRKLDVGNANAKKYQQHLKKRQQAVAAEEGVEIRKSFTTAVNGFAADLTGVQAAALAKTPGVLAVAEDEQHHPVYSSVDYLGLSGEKGVWNEQYGSEKNAGRGTVVGVIDTGYHPQNEFLAGGEVAPLRGKPKVGVPYLDVEGKIAMLKSDGSTFIGECQPGAAGSGFTGTECNSKVLSARYYADDFLKLVPPENRHPKESISPLDLDSHGTHTASTAAGNSGVKTEVDGRDFGTGSGVAPAAKVSVYKICWQDNNTATGGCYSSAAIAAIEQAIKDGVDVLNYSISGNNNSVIDPVSMAFLSAAEVGIFVSAAAGNAGPADTTVNHSAPWLTTVAASTFSNELQGTVELSDGTKYRGTSIMSSELGQTALVLSKDAGTAAAKPEDAALCTPGSLDPAKVRGKIVICDRGVIARAEKSVAVKQAEGVGMVLVNTVPGSLDLDLHAVPTVHIGDPGIKDKVAQDPSLTAALVDSDTTGLPDSPVPQVAAFSSRGPSTAVGSDLLKPDVAAPGVNVLAGVSPVEGEENFGFMSGTSMAAPHVAGFGALLLGKNPLWSPSTIKSALMTTAGDLVNEDGTTNTDNFATGAGQVDVRRMADPGLVYDSGVEDWYGFLQGAVGDIGLDEDLAIEAKDLNVPSIALGSLTGEVSVTRSVTALKSGTYRASVELPGIEATVEPSVLRLRKGQEASFTVTFKNDGAAYGEFAMGELAWQDGRHSVASPIAIRPVAVLSPETVVVDSVAGEGSASIEVTSGTDQPIDVAVEGMAKANAITAERTADPNAVTAKSAIVASLVVPEGATMAQMSINAAVPTADWDLYVITPAGEQLTQATANSSETLVLNQPKPGTYRVIGHLWGTSDGATTSTGTVNTVALSGDAGNLTVSPDPLELPNGETGSVEASWAGLGAGSWVGLIRFGDSASTALTVNVP
ncbi:S8 family serine peptidase [Arthrobacter crystallopoietes]|uniref:S8 family serine peptidase n=1 Tax=Crystallibacter crystallopoietes TaxID=37928 RepID=UPI001FC9F424|nr:S8 family serine peptidase [Arthrobacter crystallopoietes]